MVFGTIVASARDLARSKKAIPYIFLIPFLVLFTAFYAYPLVWAVWLSLHDFSIRASTFVGFSNYVRILSGGGFFYDSLGVTVIISIITIPLQVIISLVLAVLLDSGYTKMKKTMRTGYILPLVVAPAVLAMVFSLFLGSSGMINQALDSLAGFTIGFLSDPLWAKVSVAIVQAWKWIGFFVIIYLAGLQNISQELYKAAKMDGANKYQQWRHITVPQLKPITVLVMMIATTRSVRMFDIPYVLTSGGPGVETTTLVLLIYNQAFENINLGYAAALAVVFSLLLGSLLYVQHGYGESNL
jgi:ABC-type sugar transport system permease subunit